MSAPAQEITRLISLYRNPLTFVNLSSEVFFLSFSFLFLSSNSFLDESMSCSFIPFQTDDPHVIACIFKQYFARLPHPLIPSDETEELMKIHERGRDAQTYCADVSKVLQKIPHLQAVVLRFLCQFLSQITIYSPTNKMTADNLAIVFAPNLMRFRNMSDEMDPSKIVSKVAVVTSFIEQYQEIFSEIGNKVVV